MHQSYTLANSILGQACYTKNDKYALKKVLKEMMVTQHKNKKIGPSQREAWIQAYARSSYFIGFRNHIESIKLSF